MRKELPITIEPWIRTYSYYALPMCIIMSEHRIGKRVAEFEILDSDVNNWSSLNMDKGDGNRWYFASDDDYNRGCNGCIYRLLEKNYGYVRVKINFQQHSEPWAAINLFVTDDIENVLMGDKQYLCRFGNFIYDGLALCYSGKQVGIDKRYLNSDDELVLSVSDGKIEVFAGKKRLKKIGEREVFSKPLYLGVQVRHEENSFYPWLFSNFIQISCDVNCTHRRLDYYSFYKDEEYDLISYFLDYNRFNVNELPVKKCVNYLKQVILRDEYIELKIDQYYLFGHEEYHVLHHLHQNLIYGFDDRLHEFKTIGYDSSGKISKYKIHFRELIRSLKRNPKVKIKVITYRQGIHFYHFIPSYVKEVLEDYVGGINSERKVQAFLPIEERKYGLEVYEELKSGKGLDVLISDRRVSYLLFEHKQLMEKRIEYMKKIGIVSEILFKKVQKQIQWLVKESFNLIYVAQKYRLCPTRRDDDKLRKMLDKIRENERKMLVCLLEEGDW